MISKSKSPALLINPFGVHRNHVICLLIPPQHSSKLSEFPFKMPEKKQDYWIPESIKDVQFEERYTILTELGKYESLTCKVHVGNHFIYIETIYFPWYRKKSVIKKQKSLNNISCVYMIFNPYLKTVILNFFNRNFKHVQSKWCNTDNEYWQ